MKKFVIVVAALLCSSATHASEDCRLKQFASLDITTLPGGEIGVPIQISGVTHQFVLEIGGAYSAVTADLANELKMTTKSLPGRIEARALGSVSTSQAIVPDLQLGQITSHDVAMLLAKHPLIQGAEGGLGLDILSKFDVELDLSNKKLNLFSQQHCAGQVVYWGGVYTALPMTSGKIGDWHFVMQLDGKDVTVQVDSGAPVTTMGMSDAHDVFGFDENTAGLTVSPLKAIDGTILHRYRFKTLSANGVTITNPVIDIYPQKHSEECEGRESGFDICYGESRVKLGLPELRALHLYFAFGEKLLYVTAAGKEP